MSSGGNSQSMDQILGLRPFVPAKDFALSKRFYQALGFVQTVEDENVAILKLGSFSFILQKFHVTESADSCMVQLLVRDVEAWWRRVDGANLVDDFAVNPPRPAALQT